MNLRYLLGAVVSIPLLPLLYFQGKRIRASVPKLDEAKEPEGIHKTEQGGRQLRLLTIGESTIAGVGVRTHQEGFTGALAEAISNKLSASVHWRVYARSGYTAQRVTAKLIPKIAEEEVDLIVIGLGGNDAFKLNTPSQWQKAGHQLIGVLGDKFGQTPIVFLNMPPIKEFPAFTPLIKFVIGNLVEILGQALSEVVEQYPHVFYNQKIIKLEEWINILEEGTPASAFFSDGVHPSKTAYQAWGKEMAGFVVEKEVLGGGLT